VLDLLGIPPNAPLDNPDGYCRDGWPDDFEKMVVEESDFDGFIDLVIEHAKEAVL
jgi:hypothetical protein